MQNPIELQSIDPKDTVTMPRMKCLAQPNPVERVPRTCQMSEGGRKEFDGGM